MKYGNLGKATFHDESDGGSELFYYQDWASIYDHQWLMDSLFNVNQITFWLRVGVKFGIIVKLTDSNPHRDVSPAAQVADENHGDNISDLVARRNQAR